MNSDIGDRFQKETKYSRYLMDFGGFNLRNPPEQYKSYPNSKKISLDLPKDLSKISLDKVLKNRRSIRNFSEKPITKQQLSSLLWASTGIQRKELGFEFRTAPSAGALYPIETYLVINRVKDIPKGIYHYSIKDNLLEELKIGDFGVDISRAALDQDMCNKAAAVFIWTAIFNRSKWKYGERAYRYIYLDAGHIAENFALVSTGLGLGNCQIAALYDDEINEIIGVDGKSESVIYMSVVGNL
ncbi:MAG: SagB/ThcOx family dehydrogenase [Thermoplasmatales archaeon]|nr:MAG: SagB/ThcOx family dehydrogenase [Thermoplasmatales archaeon]